MCGILLDVKVVTTVVNDIEVTTTAATIATSNENNEGCSSTINNTYDYATTATNLCRRGPDHIGSIFLQLQQQQQQHQVLLQASVLKMRSHSTLQPVQLPLEMLPTNLSSLLLLKQQQQHVSFNSSHDQNNEDISSSSSSSSSFPSCYFCWNGEVYQTTTTTSLQPSSSSSSASDGDTTDRHVTQRTSSKSTTTNTGIIFNDSNNNNNNIIESVADYEIDDTKLVTNMLIESHAHFIKGVMEENYTTSTNDNESNNNDNNQTYDASSSAAIFMDQYVKSVVVHVLECLINAEYAFCFVTPWAIYYGRDPQGRRSLLYWKEEEEKGEGEEEEVAVEEGKQDSNQKPQKDSYVSRHHHHPSSWKLASVAEDSNNKNNMINPSKTLWKEVVPGIVHEYRFVTGQYHSTPILVRKQNLRLSLFNNISSPRPSGVTASMWEASLALEHYLRQAVQLRVCGTTSSLSTSTSTKSENTIAVLFSGGIDSVVLAALTLQLIPPHEPLRLWNVSFVDTREQPQQQTTNDTTTTIATKSQDCLAAQASYQELTNLFPHHTILLETTEVTWDEMMQWESHVRTLMHPKSTIMDLNISMALWFASRGRQNKKGSRSKNKNNNYGNGDNITTDTHIKNDKSDSRILLVGMGADEQLGGYGRHRKAYEQGLAKNGTTSSSSSDGETTKGRAPTVFANQCLRRELDLDIGRLWERNLGRDDRIFSDHGKEARFPYLDFHVMDFLAQTPLEDVCDLTLPPGQGDKRILRLLAIRLGLKSASGMIKRAIQFGSRIAHVSDKKRFGSRRKAQGTAAV